VFSSMFSSPNIALRQAMNISIEMLFPPQNKL
jgi:hypothetical protein